MTDALPTVMRGELDAALLERLFDDLASCAESTEVQWRECPAPRESESTAVGGDRTGTLDELRRAFASMSVVRARIRYQHDGAAWCDTLMVRAGVVSLVRMQQPRMQQDRPGDGPARSS